MSKFHRFQIGDIVTLNKNIEQDIYNVHRDEPHLLITDIDFALQKYITLVVGTNSTQHYTIQTMNRLFYKVA